MVGGVAAVLIVVVAAAVVVVVVVVVVAVAVVVVEGGDVASKYPHLPMSSRCTLSPANLYVSNRTPKMAGSYAHQIL